MAPDERSRVEASQALADQLGPAAAAALMECIPPFGWHEIATKSDLANLKSSLEEKIGGLEERLSLKFEANLHREITRMIKWTVGSIIGVIGVICAAASVIS